MIHQTCLCLLNLLNRCDKSAAAGSRLLSCEVCHTPPSKKYEWNIRVCVLLHFCCIVEMLSHMWYITSMKLEPFYFHWDFLLLGSLNWELVKSSEPDRTFFTAMFDRWYGEGLRMQIAWELLAKTYRGRTVSWWWEKGCNRDPRWLTEVSSLSPQMTTPPGPQIFWSPPSKCPRLHKRHTASGPAQSPTTGDGTWSNQIQTVKHKQSNTNSQTHIYKGRTHSSLHKPYIHHPTIWLLHSIS